MNMNMNMDMAMNMRMMIVCKYRGTVAALGWAVFQCCVSVLVPTLRLF